MAHWRSLIYFFGLRGDGIKENLKIGDTVKCKDLDDMIRTMYELAETGIQTAWDCEEIKQGLHILHVTEIEESET